MTDKLKRRIIELEKKANVTITDMAYMEQALLAVMKYEQRKTLNEQDISLIEECVDAINRLNGIDKEREMPKLDDAVQRVLERMRSNNLSEMSKDELRKIFRLRDDDDEPPEPDAAYLEELLRELHGSGDSVNGERFGELRLQYDSGKLRMKKLTAEEILGLLHSESIFIAKNGHGNMSFVVDMLREYERFGDIPLPEEDKESLQRIFIGVGLPYRRNSRKGKAIQKLMRNPDEKDYHKEMKELMKCFFGEFEKEENPNRFRVFRAKRPRLFKALASVMAVAVVLAMIQFTSVAMFEKDFFGSVFNWSKDMVISLFGKSENKDDLISLTSKNKTYSSIEEFVKAENINITVPKYIPNDLQVQKVMYTDDSENRKIHIIFNENTSLYIYMNQNLIPKDYTEVSESYISNNQEYYLYKELNKAEWLFDNNTYNLIGDFTKNEFKQIIDSLYE